MKRNCAQATLLLVILWSLFLVRFEASAAALIYTNEDVGLFTDSDLGVKRSLADLPNSAQAFAKFQSNLRAVFIETFDNYSISDTLTNIHFGTNSAQVTGIPTLEKPQSGHVVGQFAISGNQFLSVTGAIKMQFDAPQIAFGVFITDLERCAVDIVRVTPNEKRITNTVMTSFVGDAQRSGGCIFFGVIDVEEPFASIEFPFREGCTESYAFDDMMIGTPLPVGTSATLALETYPGLTITGTPQALYRIEVSATVDFSSWTTQKVLRLPTSPFLYFDEEPIKSHPRRYYRAAAE